MRPGQPEVRGQDSEGGVPGGGPWKLDQGRRPSLYRKHRQEAPAPGVPETAPRAAVCGEG